MSIMSHSQDGANWINFNSNRPDIKFDDMTIDQELDFILRPCSMKMCKTPTDDKEFTHSLYSLKDYYNKELIEGNLSISSNIIKIKRDLFTDSGYEIKKRDSPYKDGPDPYLSIYHGAEFNPNYIHPKSDHPRSHNIKQQFCEKLQKEKEVEVQFGLNYGKFEKYSRYLNMLDYKEGSDNRIDDILSPDYIKLLLEYNRYRKYEKMFEEQDSRIRKIEEAFETFNDKCKYQERKIKILEENNRLIQELRGMVKAQNIEIQQLKRNQDKRISLKDIEELQFQINELKLLNQIKMTEKSKRGKYPGLFQSKQTPPSY